MKILGTILGSIAGIFALMLIIGSTVDTTKYDEQAKKECTRAIMSSMGTSTVGYADKQAYDAHVKDKCAGFNLPD